MDIIRPHIEEDDPAIYFTAFAGKSDYLFHIESTLHLYSPVLVGRPTNKLSMHQKQAVACILNSTGLWSGQWARHLVPSPSLPVNVADVVTMLPTAAATHDA